MDAVMALAKDHKKFSGGGLIAPQPAQRWGFRAPACIAASLRANSHRQSRGRVQSPCEL
jgi:hypothetical protein